MSRPQGYIEGEVFDSRRVKSNRWTKLTAEKLALMALCLLLASALVVTYLLFELLKTREMLQNLEVKLETVKSEVTEKLPEIQPCPTVQPTCPEPQVKIITKARSTVQPTCPPCPPCPTVKYEPCDRCVAGWEHHGGKCYHFSIGKSSWNRSRADCRAEGGDLVKIDSREEQIYLDERVRGKMRHPQDKFWIGLTDSVDEGSWFWLDGSPLNKSLSFWIDGQPNNLNDTNPEGEDCGRIGRQIRDQSYKSWLDSSCTMSQRSICERPAGSM